MGITIVIVAGIVVVSIVSILGDYYTKTKVARTKSDPQEIENLRRRIAELERRAAEQDEKLSLLESDVSFTTKLLETKK